MDWNGNKIISKYYCVKKLFLLLGCALSSHLFFAQAKDLPGCKTIDNELAEVNKSFDNIVEKFKSIEDKVSLVKTYFSEFSICSEKGKIKDYGRNIEFIFHFTDAYYKGSRLEFRDFYKKIFKKLKKEFATTHVYKVSKEQSGKSSYFYEKDKEMTSSKRNIKLLLSYKDPVDETTAYSVSLIFEYYPRR
jgi:hypothetical protein